MFSCLCVWSFLVLCLLICLSGSLSVVWCIGQMLLLHTNTVLSSVRLGMQADQLRTESTTL